MALMFLSCKGGAKAGFRVMLTDFEIEKAFRYYIKHRGCYMTARGYEFYLRVFNSISHSFVALTREMSS